MPPSFLSSLSNLVNRCAVWYLPCRVFIVIAPRLSKSYNAKFTLRYYHFTHAYQKWKSYDVWFLRYGVQQTEFFVILDCILPFYSPNNTKNHNFEKMNKTPGDIIILHICTKNDNHMMYGSWDIATYRIFCYFGLFFALLPP